MSKILLNVLFVLQLIKNYEFKNIETNITIRRNLEKTTYSFSQECGIRNAKGIDFQNDIDGEAEYGEFPWIVAILKENVTLDYITDVYQCGGTLIAPNVVLTAAHCVNNAEAKSLKIRAGEWDIQSIAEPYPYTEHYVSSIIIHEAFNDVNLQNDIALLKIKGNVGFAQHINKICLPHQDHDYDGKRCFVSGWGKDVFGKEGMYQTILKKIEIPTVNFDECQNILRKKRMGKRFVLDNSFMCAGGEPDIDACTGDGGSSLICPFGNSTDRYYQAGIVAWGIKCGNEGVPGVYVNVAKFRSWIDSKFALFNNLTL